MEVIQKKYGLKKTIQADLFRYTGQKTLKSLLTTYFSKLEFRYTFWMRVAFFTKSSNKRNMLHYGARFMLRHLKMKAGIEIPYNTIIRPGFYIGHFGGIVIHPKATIGWNCNISNRVTIGMTFRGARAGAPKIGNHVYIGPGVAVIGGIKIGNNVAIGANCVVTKDVPDNAVVVGVPGKIISYAGVEGYVCNTNTIAE